MICEKILKYEYMIALAQGIFIYGLHRLNYPALLFWPFQAAILAALYGRIRGLNFSGEKQNLLFLAALIFSAPFIGCFIYRSTFIVRASSGKNYGGLKTEIENYIKSSSDNEKITTNLPHGINELQKNAVPIIDVLGGENIDIKRKAITILARMGSRHAVKLLKHALSDPSVEIKFMAATALLKLENSMRDRITRLSDSIGEIKNGEYDQWHLKRFELAKCLSEYIHSGIFDRTSGSDFHESMFNELRFITSQKPDFLAARKFLASEYALCGKYDTALETLEALLKEPAIFEPRNEKIKIEAVILFCEIHYNLKNFDKIREICFNSRKYLDEDLIKRTPEFKELYNSIIFFAERK